MSPTRVLFCLPKISNRKPESSITPCFLKALQIYTFTYGKIYPVLLDLTLINDSTVLVRVYPLRKSIFQLLWTVILIFVSLVAGIGLIVVLLKKFMRPQDSQLDHIEIAICIGYVSCLVLLYSCLDTFIKQRNKILLMNDFLNNGLRLGNFVFKKEILF